MTGFFGKIPSHGDFLTRDMPRPFLDVWDRWLQECIATSKTQLGERWLDTYLTSPIWRFALAGGICGPSAWAGVLMPSVDRVGRYFPLTIGTALEEQSNPLLVPDSMDAWLSQIEAVALRCLDDDRFDVTGLQTELAAIPEARLDSRRPELTGGLGTPWSMALHGTSPARLAADVAAALLTRDVPRFSLWWTTGAEHAAFVVAGLPDAQAFSELLGAEHAGLVAQTAVGGSHGSDEQEAAAV